ncbi:DUF883 family protein [Sulfitobacter albidus]|uniref:DUF883 family protein n=1 Tax=Sulfitobacter albidus TaxID=2829501 RepID=A0A975JCX3_9RHOB|nr:DUF883 family protein [Sulfitobacter albidus]QUJ75956.1 DUF883 family protein [Sulfitobacter albidus]
MATNTSAKNGRGSDVTVDDLSAQLERVKTDLSELTRVMGELGTAKTAQAQNAAQAKAAELRDQAYATAEHLRDSSAEKFADAQSQAQDFVRTQPATALGLAAGAGFLVGLLMTQRR